MAIELVDATQLDSDLTDIADAIRLKGGTSASLAFPADFVTAIGAIPSGGPDYMAQNIQGTLTSYESEDVTSIRSNAFRGYSSLTTLKLHNVTRMYATAIYECNGLTALAFPALSGSETVSIRGCTHLEAVDLGALSRIGGSALDGNTVMNMLVLRRTGSVTALANINALGNTPFASGKAGGILYVPNDLISSYQAASNWSTILGYATNQIKSIESTHTDPTAPIDLTLYYADGTAI